MHFELKVHIGQTFN